MTQKSDFMTAVSLLASLPWIILSITLICHQIHMVYQKKAVFITIQIYILQSMIF